MGRIATLSTSIIVALLLVYGVALGADKPVMDGRFIVVSDAVAKAAMAGVPPPRPPRRLMREYPLSQMTISVYVSESGRVETTKLLAYRGSQQLAEMVQQHILKQWRFSPNAVQGKPVAWCFTTQMKYELVPRR